MNWTHDNACYQTWLQYAYVSTYLEFAECFAKFPIFYEALNSSVHMHMYYLNYLNFRLKIRINLQIDTKLQFPHLNKSVDLYDLNKYKIEIPKIIIACLGFPCM